MTKNSNPQVAQVEVWRAFYGRPYEDWRDRAACGDRDTRFWFPDLPMYRRPAEEAVYKAAVERAVAICATCPVKGRCLDYALAQRRDDDHGIYGGTTREERERMRRRRQPGRKRSAA